MPACVCMHFLAPYSAVVKDFPLTPFSPVIKLLRWSHLSPQSPWLHLLPALSSTRYLHHGALTAKCKHEMCWGGWKRHEPKQGSQVLWVRCKYLCAPVPRVAPDTSRHSKTPDESPKWSIHIIYKSITQSSWMFGRWQNVRSKNIRLTVVETTRHPADTILYKLIHLSIRQVDIHLKC